MRGILSIAALLVAAASFADGWMLKAPYEAKAKFTWKVTVNANVGGQDHEATMKQHLSIASKTDKEIKGSGTWTDLSLDGGEQPGEEPKWDVTFNPNGSVASAGEGADYARMLVPLAFIYPDKEVKAGDKWSVKYKPAKDAKDMTVDFEVVEVGKVGDAEALKVKGKVSEDGPMKADTIYWIGKDGKLLKFDLDVKGWIVPFAGNNIELDAKIKGELVKEDK